MPQRRLNSLIGAGALLLALLLVSQLYVWVNLWPGSIGWVEAAIYALPQLLLWGLLIPLVARLARRWPIQGDGAAARVLLHTAASVALSLAALLVLDGSDRLLRWSTLMGAPGKLISDISVTIVHLHIGIGIYWVVIAAVHALRFHDDSTEKQVLASRLEAELAQAQLHALRMQLDPHFLFNTLNSIGVLMRHDTVAAEAMLHRLSDLLQSTLRHQGHHLVPLAEEVDYLRSYVRIEETRFRDRLHVEIDVDDAAAACLVPFLFLQPLVENAIRYAIAPRARGGRIQVRARARDGRLHIRVLDDGPGLPRGGVAHTGTGVGLRNCRKRLDTLFPGDHAFVLRNRDEGGLEVSIEMPGVTSERRPTETAQPCA